MPLNDPNLLDHIPNDDILYVSNAHFITKAQFGEWLRGDFEFEVAESDPGVSRFTGMLANEQPGNNPKLVSDKSATPGQQKLYIHPTSNGTIRIEDIQTSQFPEGIQLNGKWHFLSVDAIGEDTLMDSSHFQVLLGKGKVEVVPESYVAANKHKLQKKKSPYQAALDAILVPADVKAAAAADGEWKGGGDIATEILIEG
jgi:hypothetical protein